MGCILPLALIWPHPLRYTATTQRKYAKTWQMHRANKEAVKEETDAETHKPENKEDVHVSERY